MAEWEIENEQVTWKHYLGRDLGRGRDFAPGLANNPRLSDIRLGRGKALGTFLDDGFDGYYEIPGVGGDILALALKPEDVTVVKETRRVTVLREDVVPASGPGNSGGAGQ